MDERQLDRLAFEAGRFYDFRLAALVRDLRGTSCTARTDGDVSHTTTRASCSLGTSFACADAEERERLEAVEQEVEKLREEVRELRDILKGDPNKGKVRKPNIRVID